MAYVIHGKVYTSHPMMDEMIYNLDIIMSKIDIKNDVLALQYETEDSLEASDTFLICSDGRATFNSFPFTTDLLEAYGYNATFASQCVADRMLIPEEDREEVLEFCTTKFVEDYVEQNNYYRAYLGLPYLEEDEPEDKYYVYIDESYITESFLVDAFDYDLPLHEYSDYQIAILTSLGVMDAIYNEYTGSKYKYLHHIGDAKLDNYDVRIAAKWDILYMPSVETMVSDRFKQLYQINRTLYIRRFYSDAYKEMSDYYDQFMIILLLCQTYTDLISEIPEWYIRRDVFDLRSCQYFLESQGVEFFKIIPLKYQIRIVKNLNKLIKYKSTNKNIWDIIDLFDVDDVNVYEYYILKKRNTSGDSFADGYELEFIKVPIGETYDDYIKDNTYRESYDEITYQDKWWDGQDTHENVYNNHLAKEFTIEGTKFISIENRVSLSDYSYQVQYFLGLVLDSSVNLSDIKISIPTISSLVSSPLSDLFILLYCLTGAYDDYNILIQEPMNRQYGDKPEFEAYETYDGGGVSDEGDDVYFGGINTTLKMYRQNINGGMDPEYTEITQESFYDWLRWKYPYLWTCLAERVYGFNMSADLDELQELIGFRHSSFLFERGWTLQDLGVDGFMTSDDIDSIDDLVKIYETNTAIYDNLKQMIVDAESREEKVVLQFVFDYLFTKEYDYDRYTLASTGELAGTLEEVLKERNYILWKYYDKLTEETDVETRQDMIRSAMNDIIDTMSYYLNFDSLKYIFSVFTVTSFVSILKYIYLMINFFKSWKVYFLDSYVTYVADDRLENKTAMNDSLGEFKVSSWYGDRTPHRDMAIVNVEFEAEERVDDSIVEVIDIFGHHEDDPSYDMDINGGDTDDLETEENPRDINAGNVEFTSYIPFVMLNGGIVGIGLNTWDLDGAGVDAQAFYLDVDGSEADPPHEVHIPHMTYGYNTDGGHPDYHMFTSSSMMVRVSSTKEVSADVKVKPNYHGIPNAVSVADDGLLLEDKWMGYDDLYEFRTAMSDSLDYLRSFYNDSLDTIVISNIPSKANAKVVQIVDEYFSQQAFVNYHDVSGDLLDRTKEYTKKKVEELQDLFDAWVNGTALIGWSEF